MMACDQVRVGRLSFAVGSVQFSSRQSLNAMLTILPVVIVIAATAVVVITACMCWFQQRVVRRRSKLSPTRTEYNVNYVHISEPSLQSNVSGTVAAQSHAGIYLPQTSELLTRYNTLRGFCFCVVLCVYQTSILCYSK